MAPVNTCRDFDLLLLQLARLFVVLVLGNAPFVVLVLGNPPGDRRGH
jgi:hypothetical protein